MFEVDPVLPDGRLTEEERAGFESGRYNILGPGNDGREPIACLWAAYKRVETELDRIMNDRVLPAEDRLDKIRELCEQADKKVYVSDILRILEDDITKSWERE